MHTSSLFLPHLLKMIMEHTMAKHIDLADMRAVKSASRIDCAILAKGQPGCVGINVTSADYHRPGTSNP